VHFIEYTSSEKFYLFRHYELYLIQLQLQGFSKSRFKSPLQVWYVGMALWAHLHGLDLEHSASISRQKDNRYEGANMYV
jgi:hypothetical protein